VTAGGSGRVVCVALNPALDITYVSERFAVGEANRVSRVHAQAGGKAVNVARLLRQAGHDVVVTGFVGGLVGDEIVGQLDEWAVPHCLIRSAAGSRRTVSAFSAEDAAATAYNLSRASHGRTGCAGRQLCPPRRCGSLSPVWSTLTMSLSWKLSSR
jgi:fructose-1-phosphate kinase PfkB-like protein